MSGRACSSPRRHVLQVPRPTEDKSLHLPPPNLVSSNRLNGLDPSPPLQGQGQGKDKMSAPKYQPYAPSPYSYTPSPHSLSTSISLDEEVKLSTTSQQRELNESLAEIFSIIVTLDFLEKAYIKDSINQEEYRTHFLPRPLA